MQLYTLLRLHFILFHPKIWTQTSFWPYTYPSFGRSWPIRPCVAVWRSSRRGRVSGHTRPASVCWCSPASPDTCRCWRGLPLEPANSLWTALFWKANTYNIKFMLVSTASLNLISKSNQMWFIAALDYIWSSLAMDPDVFVDSWLGLIF